MARLARLAKWSHPESLIITVVFNGYAGPKKRPKTHLPESLINTVVFTTFPSGEMDGPNSYRFPGALSSESTILGMYSFFRWKSLESLESLGDKIASD